MLSVSMDTVTEGQSVYIHTSCVLVMYILKRRKTELNNETMRKKGNFPPIFEGLLASFWRSLFSFGKGLSLPESNLENRRDRGTFQHHVWTPGRPLVGIIVVSPWPGRQISQLVGTLHDFTKPFQRQRLVPLLWSLPPTFFFPFFKGIIEITRATATWIASPPHSSLPAKCRIGKQLMRKNGSYNFFTHPFMVQLSFLLSKWAYLDQNRFSFKILWSQRQNDREAPRIYIYPWA